MIEINHKKYYSKKIIEKQKLSEIINKLKSQKKIIGLCTGSFDLLHPGHIKHINDAKKLCNILVIAIARNNFSSNKNPESGRPIYSYQIRGFMVSQLKSVDYVTFDNGGIKEILLLLKPNFYIKGIDYIDLKNVNIIKQKKIIESIGGKIVFTKGEKISTSDIIKHIKNEIKLGNKD